MEPKEFLAFLARLEKLKCNTRHSWTSSGRHESVAEHSWRLAMLALLLRDALPEVDMDKVLRMCLIHDVGEAVTGDIPSFQKTDANEETERQAIAELLSPLPDGLRGELTALFAEMDALATPEARVYKALDKLEVVVQHNEAPLDTWLPLEYELNQTYGIPEAAPFPPLAALREQARLDTLAKPGFALFRSAGGRQQLAQFPHRALQQPGHGQLRHSSHQIVTLVQGDEDPPGPGLPHRYRHGRGDLPHQGVGDDDAQGAQNHIRPAAGHQQGVLSRGPLRRAALEHGGGGQAVGSDGGHLHLGITG